MLLRRVELVNYRAFADVSVDLDDTTVFIGENNIGKTSLLEAIRLALTQTPNRRGDTFDDYDHYLTSNTAKVGDAGDTSITLHFAESSENEWSDDIVQSLSDVIIVDGELHKVIFRLRSAKEAGATEPTPSWEFLDAAGSALKPRRPLSILLRDLQQLKPFFYLSAMRDAGREFQPRSTFWGPFIRDPKIAEAVQQQIEADLNNLNARVIAADARLSDVRDRLAKAKDIVAIGASDAIAIEAVPARARDLLSRAQVAVAGRTGARLPLTRHGAGTQSLSVLFLFEAFLASMLGELYGPDSVPILALEEPEAHLHPAATRALWRTISGMPGQKIIATHSGDLLARVPLADLRRVCSVNGRIAVRRLNPQTLSDDDARKITLHVRATRGELLFARSWLLVEGASEVWLFEGIAEVLGIDLEREGVRIVQYAQVGVSAFIKLADDLGIGWFCFSDGDSSGQAYKATAVEHLNGRNEADRVLALPEANIEVHLCASGFGQVLEAEVSPQKGKNITANKGDAHYWDQVVDALPNKRKEARIILVLEAIRRQGAGSVSSVLKQALAAVIRLAGGHYVP